MSVATSPVGLERRPPRDDLTMSSDGQLVDALSAGDLAALDAICARYQRQLHAHIRRFAGPGAPVEEIAQDVFLRFWTTATRFDSQRGALGSYLHLIAKGKALDWIRSETARRRREDQYRPPPDPDRSDDLEMRAAVEALPLKEHRAVWLAYYMGFTYRQVAAILDIPEGTAKAQLSLALRHLHTLLAIQA
jgi:RNA polymerase sigma-70 factor (ECF subfamily)